MNKHTCLRCGHSWIARHATPGTCPACRSPNWEKPASVYHCFKCNHVWATRTRNKPQRCAGCNALLTRYAVWYDKNQKAYKKSRQYKKLKAIFNRAQRYKRKR